MRSTNILSLFMLMLMSNKMSRAFKVINLLHHYDIRQILQYYMVHKMDRSYIYSCLHLMGNNATNQCSSIKFYKCKESDMLVPIMDQKIDYEVMVELLGLAQACKTRRVCYVPLDEIIKDYHHSLLTTCQHRFSSWSAWSDCYIAPTTNDADKYLDYKAKVCTHAGFRVRTRECMSVPCASYNTIEETRCYRYCKYDDDLALYRKRRDEERFHIVQIVSDKIHQNFIILLNCVPTIVLCTTVLIRVLLQLIGFYDMIFEWIDLCQKRIPRTGPYAEHKTDNRLQIENWNETFS
ncbi:hypothetical protein SNEBB_009127 [Seison nebaliae]|nr:hypothetical protein SNEBB_009127 [Seison nebaliae]